jgi:hypothetical protein
VNSYSIMFISSLITNCTYTGRFEEKTKEKFIRMASMDPDNIARRSLRARFEHRSTPCTRSTVEKVNERLRQTKRKNDSLTLFRTGFVERTLKTPAKDDF